MNNKKFIFAFTCLTSFAAMIGVFAPNMSVGSLPRSANAEDCSHGSDLLVHYEATGTSRDHYACCGCHQAWADEELTVLLSSNTATDRKKLDGEAYYNISHEGTDYAYKWDDNAQLCAVEKLGSLLFKTFKNTTVAYIQTIDTTATVMEGSIHEVEVTNNTDSRLLLTSNSRTWDSDAEKYELFLDPGETSLIKISSYCWNNHTKPDELKGFAIRLSNVEIDQPFSGEVIFNRPHAYKQQDLFESISVGDEGSVEVLETWDETYGRVYTFNVEEISGWAEANATDNKKFGTPKIYIKDVKYLDPAIYDKVEVYVYQEGPAGIEFTAWSEDWNDHRNWVGWWAPNNTTQAQGQITIDTWNGDRNTCDVGFYDMYCATGYISLAFNAKVKNDFPGYYNAAYAINGDYEPENGGAWVDTNVKTSFNENGVEVNAFTFKENTTNGYFQTNDTETTVLEGEIYEVEVTNNTEYALIATSTSRTWDAATNTYNITLNPGESSLLKVSYSVWNNETYPDKAKGFSIGVRKVNGGAFSGEVAVSRPTKFDFDLVGYLEATNYNANNRPASVWHNYKEKENNSNVYGRVFSFNKDESIDTNYVCYLRDLKAIDATLYEGVEVFFHHASEKTVRINLGSENWNESRPNNISFNAYPNTYNRVVIPANVWNHALGAGIGFYDYQDATGIISIAVHGLIAK